MSCRTELKRIDRFLLGELTPSEWSKLKVHLDGCEACAQQYNRAVFVLRQLSGSPDGVAEEEWALMGPELTRRERPGARWRAWVLAAVPLAAAVVLTFLLAPSGAGEVQDRGGARHAPVALRAYCVSEAQPTLRVVAASGTTGALRCGHDELVQFAYQLSEGEPRWLHLAGVDADGQLLRYYPRPNQTSLQLEPGSSEQVLPGSIRLAGRHHPGLVQVVGLVTATPLSPDEGDARAMQVAREPGASTDTEVVKLTLEVLP